MPLPVPPTAPGGKNWHRFHYPVGVFLLAYGVTGIVSAALGWSDRRDELAGYLGSGVATPLLVTVKVLEGLLLLVALAGLIRRRDVWFLPALTGWVAGFAVFCVLDVVKGKWTGLLEHALYLAFFLLLLGLTYALSVKARVGGRKAPPAPSPVPAGPPDQHVAPAGGGLTRTQELALAALNRWQRGVSQQPAPQQQPVPQQQQLTVQPQALTVPPQGVPQQPAPQAMPPHAQPQQGQPQQGQPPQAAPPPPVPPQAGPPENG
ncbi:hypothetical protein [Spirillospora sp. NPDC047279]|uniref:hypothetical protein n=1 Tax=Spirillospora sp. NPDC047279 TaxID=3155478 RepID=UPI00340F9946